jgi:glucose-1-phosphate thymidylyltransferase
MPSGIREILIISTPTDLPQFEALRDGSFGVPVTTRTGRPRIRRLARSLILGDNIFYGAGLPELCHEAARQEKGATIFAYAVDDPSGTASFPSTRAHRAVD